MDGGSSCQREVWGQHAVVAVPGGLVGDGLGEGAEGDAEFTFGSPSPRHGQHDRCRHRRQCQSGPSNGPGHTRRGRPPGIRATGYGPAGNLRRSQAPRLGVPAHPNPRLPDILNGPGQARHASSAPPAARRSPAADSAPRESKNDRGPGSHKIPTLHKPYRTSPAPCGSSRRNSYPLARRKNRKLPR